MRFYLEKRLIEIMGNVKFKKKSWILLKRLPLEEVANYYMELRKYQYDYSLPLKGIKLRKTIHYLLLLLIKIDRILSKETLTVIGDKRIKTGTPKIYAATHIGGNDIQRTFEAIKYHAYLFLGDPKGIYTDLTGIILYLNGAICLETDNKNDRNIAYKRALELLRRNGNLLIYPEGAWNITDNLPVMGLYKGVINMAKETGAEIVPIAIEQYNNNFYVNIGTNYSISDKKDIKEANKDLRDKLATLKWEIFEKQGVSLRADVPNSYSDIFKQSIIDRCGYGFTIEDVYRTMYKERTD